MIIRTASHANTEIETAIKTSHSSDYSSASPKEQMPRTKLKRNLYPCRKEGSRKGVSLSKEDI
jgi:hypothetical protein